MKIACFSDLHGHIFKDFDGKSDITGSKRLDNIVNTLVYIRDYCVEKNITKVLFGGDLFHIRGRVNVVVYNALYDAIKTFYEHGIEIVAIAGNHDQIDNSDIPEHSLHAMKDLPGVSVYGDLDIHTLEENGEYADIYCVPYSKNAQRIKDWIASQEMLTLNSSRICLFHLGIDGGFVGKGNYPMADAFKVDDLRPDFFKYVLGGHFHKHQFLEGHPHVLYTGAPIQHTFSDEGEEKGFFVVDTTERCHIEFVPVRNPQFITMSSTDILNEDMEKHRDEGNYIRIQVNEKDLQLVLTHLPEGLHYKIELQKDYEENTRVDVKIGMSEEEIVTNYSEEYNPEALEMGLNILSEVKGR